MGYLVFGGLAALVIWAFLTWWNADEHITFKLVVQNALRDIREIIHPLASGAACHVKRLWAFVGPRITNLPTLAVIALDLYATMTPEMRDLIASDHRAAAVLLALNLVARLSPRNAPQTIPPAPNGALVNNGALA